jgi:phospholipase/carboxylesterase
MATLSLVHLVRRPLVEARFPPLLLLLHGVGGNEHNLFDLASSLDERFLILSVRAPNTLEPDSYAWFEVNFTEKGPIINWEQAERSRRALFLFITEAVLAYDADPEQVYLMGFSQGAIMSASLALTRPDLVAGAVLMSGRILQEIQPFIVAPEDLAGLPILVVHGALDAVVPITSGRAARELLSSFPVELTYREYQTMGHEVTPASLTDVTIWLSAHLDAAQKSRRQSMSINNPSLMTVYKGWDDYQTSLVNAITLLSPAQLAYRPAPNMRSVGEVASHISFGRIDWFQRMHAPGSDELARQVKSLGAEDAIAENPAELVRWLEASWQMIEKTLSSWTVADLERTYKHSYQGKAYAISHQWTIWRILAHDLHHGGELAVMLGTQGIPIPELGDFGGHITQPSEADSSS